LAPAPLISHVETCCEFVAQAISLLPAFGDCLRNNRAAPAQASSVHQRVLRIIAG
jgi:hypothetical protein